MKRSFVGLRCLSYTVALLAVCGCGGSKAPAVTSSQDELSAYLEAHPELKEDAKPDEIVRTGT